MATQPDPAPDRIEPQSPPETPPIPGEPGPTSPPDEMPVIPPDIDNPDRGPQETPTLP